MSRRGGVVELLADAPERRAPAGECRYLIPDSTDDSNMALKKKHIREVGVAAVNRALTVVVALESAGEAISLAELSRRTGLYKSTLLRLIDSLEHFALVVAKPDKKYCLGPLAFRLGRAFEATDYLRGSVMPALERLVAQGTESASFHVRHDPKHRLCLFRVDSTHSTLDRVKAGDLLPIDKGAAGKAIRMFERQSPEDRVDTDMVVESFGERNPIIAGMSAPVFGGGDHFYGVITLSGPIERFTDANTRKMKRLLTAACREVTASLGGKWPWS